MITCFVLKAAMLMCLDVKATNIEVECLQHEGKVLCIDTSNADVSCLHDTFIDQVDKYGRSDAWLSYMLNSECGE